mgnify:FL=1
MDYFGDAIDYLSQWIALLFCPMEKFYEIAQKEHSKLITPKIGELVHLNKLDTIYTPWWQEVD